MQGKYNFVQVIKNKYKNIDNFSFVNYNLQTKFTLANLMVSWCTTLLKSTPFCNIYLLLFIIMFKSKFIILRDEVLFHWVLYAAT